MQFISLQQAEGHAQGKIKHWDNKYMKDQSCGEYTSNTNKQEVKLTGIHKKTDVWSIAPNYKLLVDPYHNMNPKIVTQSGSLAPRLSTASSDVQSVS